MDAIALRVVRHTRDFDGMLRFYRDILGMILVEGWDHPGNRGALLSAGEMVGDALIEILDLDNLAVPDTTPVNVELSIQVKDAVAWHDGYQAGGGDIARGLEDTPWGHRSFGIDDPDGLRIWLYEEISRSLR